MTVREMDDVIQDYCCSCPCSSCKIETLCNSVSGDFKSNPKVCEQAYNLLLPLDHPVTHPSHYTQGDIQCIDAMIAAFGKEAVATWCKINAFKYVWREEHKNGMEDIDKALWYLTKYKELKSA